MQEYDYTSLPVCSSKFNPYIITKLEATTTVIYF